MMNKSHIVRQKKLMFVKMTPAGVQKAKESLGLPGNQKLPRCLGKSRNRVNKYEEEGNFEHSDKKHLCNDCRCRNIAGQNTSHLGVGYCLSHDAVVGRKKGVKVMEAHKLAIRQGYPDKGYEYAVEDPDGYIAKIRKETEDSKANRNFEEEWTLLKGQVQKLVGSYRDGESFTVRVRGELVEADDIEKATLLTKLVGAIGKIGIEHQKIMSDSMVSFEEVKTWAAGTINLVERMAPDEEFRNTFVGEFAKLLNGVSND